MGILNSCRLNFKKWRHNPRYWIVAAILLVFSRSAAVTFHDISFQSGRALSPWLLPFLLIDRYLLFCIALCLVITFCDAPFLDCLQPYCLQKIGRRKWLLGQICYIIVCSFLFFSLLWLSMVLVSIRQIELSRDWGACLRMLARDNPFLGAFAPEIILKQEAVRCSLRAFLMSWAVGSLIGMLLLFLNLHIRRELGAFAVSAVSVIDFVLCNYFDDRPALFWISPISWMNPMQYTGDGQWKWSVRICIVLALLILLGLLSMRKMLRCPVETSPEI